MPTSPALLGDVARVAGCPPRELYAIAARASGWYRETELVVPGKTRTLLVPSPVLMRIQSRIYKELLKPIAVARCVYSTAGRSCRANAAVHVRHPYLSVFDIQDCYPSIGPRRVLAALRRHGFDDAAAQVIVRLCTVRHQLPQGAPTSSALLNLVLVDLDGKLDSIARGAGLSYTRYVDDVFLSGGARAVRMARVFERVFLRHRLELRLAKRRDWGPHDRHTVTGIVVNTRPNATAEFLLALRRLLLEHSSGTSVLGEAELVSVRGQLAYIRSLNPGAATRLEQLLQAQAPLA